MTKIKTKGSLALIGGGGFSKEIAEVARLMGYRVEATYSSRSEAQVGQYRGYLDELLTERTAYAGVALAVGGVSRAAIRARGVLIAWLEEHGIPCPALVSPHSVISAGVEVGTGAYVAHGAIINVDVRLGAFCVVNTGAIVGHDTVLGANTTVSPGAFIGGRCTIGEDGLVGPLAKILQGVSVGRGAMIGMACNVLRNLRDDATIWPRPDIPASVPERN